MRRLSVVCYNATPEATAGRLGRPACRGTIRCTRVAEPGVLTMENHSRRPGDRRRSPTKITAFI
ncbi:hypothetical protein RESH_04224 [Rhodopirellula europaea SH398]|uniref:Uncharacterized protein n=1 Tax=Rhodopirellula europaea SH398 TaxID=1263868 RepID=M5S0W3_9BACT|nr:hypothetical protein RESH_04224 [Rhodopirellula europaea SH398]